MSDNDALQVERWPGEMEFLRRRERRQEVDRERAEADATFRGVATEMYEALRAFVAAERGHGWNDCAGVERRAYDAARNAIAKYEAL